MADGFYILDGNEVLLDDIPAVVELIERTARWVNPETFSPWRCGHRTRVDRSMMHSEAVAIPTPERRLALRPKDSKAMWRHRLNENELGHPWAGSVLLGMGAQDSNNDRN